MGFQVLRDPRVLRERCNVEVQVLRQIVDDRAESFKVSWHPRVIDVFDEFVCCPLLFAICCCEAKVVDRVAIEGGGFSTVNHGIVTVDADRPVIVRDREREDFPIDLVFALDEPEKFNDGPDCERHAVSILPVGDVEGC